MSGRTREPQAPGILLVRDGARERRFELDGEGMVIGRSAACDVVLADPRVSSQHARVFLDPAGRWVVEDLDSKNGTWLAGSGIHSQPVLPGQTLHIGPFQLDIVMEAATWAPPPLARTTTAPVEQDPETQLSADRGAGGLRLTADCLKRLNELAARLTGESEVTALYPAVCDYLAASEDSVALALRLAARGRQGPAQAEVLAWRHGRGAAAGHLDPPRLSQRVLSEVQRTGQVVAASALKMGRPDMDLTCANDQRPRAVVCVPISEPADAIDVLYVDLPADTLVPALRDFIQAVAWQVNLARKSLLLGELRVKWRIIEEQLTTAREIQQRLTPPSSPQMPGLDVYVHYRPATHVGGDYCDVWQRADGQVALAVGDVSGHGLAAAMVMATLHAAFRTDTMAGEGPAKVMTGLNRYLHRHLPEDVFVTMALLFFDPPSGRLGYVNAGHFPPLLVEPGAPVRPLGSGQMLLGVADATYSAETCHLADGAAVLLYTDGVTESRSLDDEMFGDQRLLSLLGAREAAPAAEIVRALVEAEEQFRRPLGQRDDLTLLAARRLR